jgi:DNA-binding Lrp family transcriptional regulator
LRESRAIRQRCDHVGAEIGKILRAVPVIRYGFTVLRTALDATDMSVLELLIEDGRRSASEVGRRVNLSPAAAKRRIDKLERLGVIVGYRAVVDQGKLGNTIEAFAELRFEGKTQVDDIDNAFVDIPELVEAFTMAGDTDALLRLRVGDLGHLKRVVDRIRRTDGVTGTKTLIVLGATGSGNADGRSG